MEAWEGQRAAQKAWIEVAQLHAAPPSPTYRRWTAALRLVAQLAAWESQLAARFCPPPHCHRAVLRAMQGPLEALVAQGGEFVRVRGQPERLFQVLQMLACLDADDVAPLLAQVGVERSGRSCCRFITLEAAAPEQPWRLLACMLRALRVG